MWNAIKGGQTVPMKFKHLSSGGGAQVTTVADAFTGAGFSAVPGQLNPAATRRTKLVGDLSTGATELRYDGTQFIQNWKMLKVPGPDLCYRAGHHRRRMA